jgi:hypothetical protein
MLAILTGLLGQLEPDRPARLPLTDRCAIDGLPVRSNVLHFQTNHIAAPQFAVDGQEHGQLAFIPRWALGCGRRGTLVILHGRSPSLQRATSLAQGTEITSASGLNPVGNWLPVRMVGTADGNFASSANAMN